MQQIEQQLKNWSKGNTEKEHIIVELRAMWARIIDSVIIKHVFTTNNNTIILCGKAHADFLIMIFKHFSAL